MLIADPCFEVVTFVVIASYHNKDFTCRFSTQRWSVRNYSQEVEKTAPSVNRGVVTPLPPLSEPMPNLPPVTYSTATADDSRTEVTVLSNGLRIASEKKFGQFCTAGGKNELVP